VVQLLYRSAARSHVDELAAHRPPGRKLGKLGTQAQTLGKLYDRRELPKQGEQEVAKPFICQAPTCGLSRSTQGCPMNLILWADESRDPPGRPERQSNMLSTTYLEHDGGGSHMSC
jgi:hypothetical protein